MYTIQQGIEYLEENNVQYFLENEIFYLLEEDVSRRNFLGLMGLTAAATAGATSVIGKLQNPGSIVSDYKHAKKKVASGITASKIYKHTTSNNDETKNVSRRGFIQKMGLSAAALKSATKKI